MSFLFSGGGSKSKTSSNEQAQQQQDPWAPAMPYLIEALQTGKGVFDQGKDLTPEEEAARQQQIGVLRTRMSDPFLEKMRTAGGELMDMRPDVQRAAPIGNPGSASSVLKPPGMGGMGAMTVGPGKVNLRPGDALKTQIASTFGTPPNPESRRRTPDGATSPVEPKSFAPGESTPQVSAVAARAGQGVLDPTGALAKTLSGQVDNPQLERMAEAATRAQSRTYRDAIQDSDESLSRSVLPAIRSGAVQAGGYGGSRQGIAEGLAISDRNKNLDRAARDLGIATGDATAGLYGNAYESAQNRMASTADSLDARAAAIATANAERTEGGRRFDTELGEDTRRFNTEFGEGVRRYDKDFAEGGRRFDTSTALDAKKFDVGTNLDVAKTNAGLTLSNNSQEMERLGMIPGLMGAGSQLYGNASNWQDQDFGNLMSVLGLPRSLAFDAYGNYVGPLTGIAGLGGQGTGKSSGTSKTSGFNFNFAVGK